MQQNLDFCPTFLQKLLTDGYVLWFVDGERRDQDKKTKQGKQFWLDNGKLHAKTVRMFRPKEESSGAVAERTLKNHLDALNKTAGRIMIKRHSAFWVYSDMKLKDAVKDLMKRIGLETKKKHRKGTYLDQIEDMWPEIELHWHKKRTKNEDSFNAEKSKTAVFKWMVKKYKDMIIVPEFGIGKKFEKTSIVDMAGFGKNKIVLVEIKAEKDNFSRLEHQLRQNMELADEVWLAIFNKKKIPDIPDEVGILSINDDGTVKILKPASKLKQNREWVGHIWYKEWQTIFARKDVPKELKRHKNSNGADAAVKSFLKTRSREFTIDVWRSRFQFEFLWRIGLLNSGDETGAYAKRGGERERLIMQKHFNDNFSKKDKIGLPNLIKKEEN